MLHLVCVYIQGRKVVLYRTRDAASVEGLEQTASNMMHSQAWTETIPAP